jgi:alkylhydroperoxidase family enzyme
MTNIGQQRKALTERILDGAGTASPSERRAAFENTGLAESVRTLIQKVATQATAVSDHDVAMARASGLTEDQIFEIVVCAAVGQSTRQYDSARAALDSATSKE